MTEVELYNLNVEASRNKLCEWLRYIDFLCRVLSTSEIGLLKALDANGAQGNGFAMGAASILNDAEADLKSLRRAAGAPVIPPEKLSYLFGVWRMEGDAQNSKS